MKFTKRDVPTSSGGSGMFLKFKDGENKVGVLVGEVYEFSQMWENGKSHVVSDDHPGAKSRFRLNFITKEDGILKARVFEFGLMVYNQLAEISEDYSLETTAVKITRRGTGTDTTYTIIPLPVKLQPDAKQLKAIQEIELNILNHPAPVAAVKNYAPTGSDDGSDVPF